MNDLRKAAEMALEALENMNPYPASKEDLRNDAITALRQALDHVPDTMKMTEPEELVCVCGAIWQGQEMICPPRCLEEGIEREMPTDRGAWSDVPDATKWVDELRGDEEPEQEPVAYMTYKGYLYHASDPKVLEHSDPTPLYFASPSKPCSKAQSDQERKEAAEHYLKLIRDCVLTEREACAKVIENDCHDDMTRAEEAAAIRARGDKHD